MKSRKAIRTELTVKRCKHFKHVNKVSTAEETNTAIFDAFDSTAVELLTGPRCGAGGKEPRNQNGFAQEPADMARLKHKKQMETIEIWRETAMKCRMAWQGNTRCLEPFRIWEKTYKLKRFVDNFLFVEENWRRGEVPHLFVQEFLQTVQWTWCSTSTLVASVFFVFQESICDGCPT